MPDDRPVYQVGEPFNPWHKVCGFHPSEYIGRLPRKALSSGVKLVYARLLRFAGRDGHCWPSQRVLAAETGISERQIRSDLAALERFGLIRRRVVGRGRRHGVRTHYEFLFHEVFTGAYKASQMSTPKPVTTGSELPDVKPLHPEETDSYIRKFSSVTSGSLLPLNTVQESLCSESVQRRAEQSGNTEQAAATEPAPPAAALPDEIKHVQEALFDRTGQIPGGDLPEKLLGRAKELGGTVADLVALIGHYRRKRSNGFFRGALERDFPAWLEFHPRETEGEPEEQLELYSDNELEAQVEPDPPPVERIRPPAQPQRPPVACPDCRDWGVIDRAGELVRCHCDAGAGVDEKYLILANKRTRAPVEPPRAGPGNITEADVMKLLAGRNGKACTAIVGAG